MAGDMQNLPKAKSGKGITKIGHTGVAAYGKDEKAKGTIPKSYEQK